MPARRIRDRTFIDVLEVGSAAAWALGPRLYELTNRIGATKSAIKLHLPKFSAAAVYGSIRSWNNTQPLERLAACCYADPGVTPEDVAGWFGRSLRWGNCVLDLRDEFRAEWPCDLETERRGCGMLADDPEPEYIKAMCQKFLASGEIPLCDRVLSAGDFTRRWRIASLSLRSSKGARGRSRVG